MDGPLTDDSPDTDELLGGLMPANTVAMEALFDPKQSQGEFTGRALLDPGTQRLRPKDAMQFWSSMKSQPKPTPLPRVTEEKSTVLEQNFAAANGARAFWQLLETNSPRQRASLARDRRDPWITWKEATAFYRSKGGVPKSTRAIAERQEQLEPAKTKVLDELFYGKFHVQTFFCSIS